MQIHEEQVRYLSLAALNMLAFLTGVGLLLIGVSFDWSHLLTLVRFPSELNNRWVQADLATLRAVCVITATAFIFASGALWRHPQIIAKFINKMDAFARTAAGVPWFVPLFLVTLVLLKSALQLALYLVGYSAYAADDFGRTLSASYWLHYRTFHLGMEGWLGLVGTAWLPFSDYVFGLGLALYPDLYLTPKIVNLVISGIAVIVVYLLGREMFGRSAGLLTALLFAFQPCHVWLGMSGMTSDLPNLVLITLFGLFLFRWFRTDGTGSLLAAAVSLGIANGFRYESWLFSVVFSLLLVFIALSRWRRERSGWRCFTLTGCALVITNIWPIVWATASYVFLGNWTPVLQTNNPLMWRQISMPLLALGAFPFELALSSTSVALFLISDKRKPFCLYLLMLTASFLLFTIAFKAQLPAVLMAARYLLTFVVLLLPFAGFFLVRLFRMGFAWRNQSVVAICLVLLVMGSHDIGRAFNYPDMFPKDAIHVGRTVRGLQETGTISEHGKILIERADDWGDLGIAVIANRPERFVAINELAYRRVTAQALPYQRDKTLVSTTSVDNETVRGAVCDEGFQVEACKNSVLREKFKLVILLSPKRVSSFQDAFHVRSWNVGRYHIFDMNSLLPSTSTQSQSGKDEISSQ